MFGTLSLLIALQGVTLNVTKDIEIATVNGTSLKADFYPATPSVRKPDPLVIVIHGGAWISGKKEDMAELCLELQKRGMSAASVSYRLGPKDKWPAMLDDVQTAVRFFRTHAEKYNVDPNRFAASGGSAGGHLALLLGFSDTRDEKSELFPGVSSRVSAVFNIFGPTDLTQDYDPLTQSVVSQNVIGKKAADATEDAKKMSPIVYIDKGDAPVFTMHGDADKLVPVKQAQRLDEALKAVGISHELRIIPGMAHGVDRKIPECNKALEEGVRWLANHLGVGERMPIGR